MKKITIYERTIKEKTGFKKYPFREVDQVIIIYNNGEIKNNHYESETNERLKIKFKKTFETRKKEDLKKFIENLPRTASGKFKKEELTKILKSHIVQKIIYNETERGEE